MPQFGKTSRERLSTCHYDLRLLMDEVVKTFDCTIICGKRTDAEQAALYAQGRTIPGAIVTKVDGVTKKSRHQVTLDRPESDAVDVVPYPVNWRDTNRMYYFAGHVMATAKRMGIKIRWGGDWDSDTEVGDQTFMDLPHFEILR